VTQPALGVTALMAHGASGCARGHPLHMCGVVAGFVDLRARAVRRCGPQLSANLIVPDAVGKTRPVQPVVPDYFAPLGGFPSATLLGAAAMRCRRYDRTGV
jgi:hypothetical protein